MMHAGAQTATTQTAAFTAAQTSTTTTPPAGGMGGGAMSGGPGSGSVGFGGNTGILRMFNESFGPNIAWLLPLALVGGGLVIWLLRRAPRDNKERVGVLLWFGWILIHTIVFSMTSGTIHPYYVVVMAPAVAALVGIGSPYIWKAYTRRTKVSWILPLSIALTTIVSVIMLGYSNYWPVVTWLVIIAGGAASIMTLLPLTQPKVWFKRTALGLAVVAAMIAPVMFSFSTIATAHTGSIPTAGPSATAMQGSNNENSSAESALVTYLLANQDGATWIAAVDSANQSAAIQISTGQPVMALGGFNGSDTPLTLAQFKQLVSEGKVRYYVVSSNGMGRGGPGGGNSEISTWAKSAGTAVNYGGSQYTVYDLSSAT